MTKHWTEAEVEVTVADYFGMLRLELLGQKYNKTKHRRVLKAHLHDRTDGSIELKHQNISAVLIEMGIPYIDGYKPRYNYQRSLLPSVISNYLREHPGLQQLIATDTDIAPPPPEIDDYIATFERPPKPDLQPTGAIAEDIPVYNPAGINYLEREARNSILGEAGEQFVIGFERSRLTRAGKDSLADRIEQVSTTQGPSAGFDILSFEEDGTDRYIEAKTTKYGKSTPFFVTPNELRFSQKQSSRYFLYRVFKFRDSPRFFSLHGQIQDQCTLIPSEYIAKLASPGFC